jgi:hypothetical protein
LNRGGQAQATLILPKEYIVLTRSSRGRGAARGDAANLRRGLADPRAKAVVSLQK